MLWNIGIRIKRGQAWQAARKILEQMNSVSRCRRQALLLYAGTGVTAFILLSRNPEKEPQRREEAKPKHHKPLTCDVIDKQWENWSSQMAHVRLTEVKADERVNADLAAPRSGNLILFNTNQIRIDNEVFEGCLRMRVDDNGSAGEGSQAGVESESVPQPLWSLELAGKFKREIRGKLLMGFELPTDPNMGFVGHSLSNIALRLGEIFSGMPIYYSLYGSDSRRPYICAQMLDYCTETKEGPEGEVRLRYDNYCLDLLGLRCTQLPGIQEFGIAAFLPSIPAAQKEETELGGQEEDKSRVCFSFVVYEEEEDGQRRYLFKGDLEYACVDGLVQRAEPLVKKQEFVTAMTSFHKSLEKGEMLPLGPWGRPPSI